MNHWKQSSSAVTSAAAAIGRRYSWYLSIASVRTVERRFDLFDSAVAVLGRQPGPDESPRLEAPDDHLDRLTAQLQPNYEYVSVAADQDDHQSPSAHLGRAATPSSQYPTSMKPAREVPRLAPLASEPTWPSHHRRQAAAIRPYGPLI